MKKVINRKASFKYQLLERLEAGVVLTGPEVRSIKNNRVSIADAYVRIKDNELWLVNAQVPLYEAARVNHYDPGRSRKLLAHRSQILHWQKKADNKKLVIIPTAMYAKKGVIKVEIALAKGKKQYEKREVVKKRDLEREAQRIIKSYNT